MDEPLTFGDLRSLLQQPPSARLWELIAGQLWAWEDLHERDEVILPYVASHLERWPLGMMALPQTWLRALVRRDDPRLTPALLTLARLIHFGGWMFWEFSAEELAAALSAAEPLRPLRGLWLEASAPGALGDVWRGLQAGAGLDHITMLSVDLPPEHALHAARDWLPCMTRLSHLRLKHGRLDYGAWLGWARALSERALKLRKLCLIDARLGGRGATHDRFDSFSPLALWERLEGLHLFGCFEDDSADRFAMRLFGAPDSPRWDNLQALDLGGDQLCDAGVSALISAPRPALHTLALHLNPISARALLDIAGADTLPALRAVLAPPRLCTPDMDRIFAARGARLIAADDPRPLAVDPERWFVS